MRIIIKTRVDKHAEMDDDKNVFCRGREARQRKTYLCILEAIESGGNGGRGVWRSWSSQGRIERRRATVLLLA